MMGPLRCDGGPSGVLGALRRVGRPTSCDGAPEMSSGPLNVFSPASQLFFTSFLCLPQQLVFILLTWSVGGPRGNRGIRGEFACLVETGSLEAKGL